MSGSLDSLDSVQSRFANTFPQLNFASFYEVDTQSVNLEISSTLDVKKQIHAEALHMASEPGFVLEAELTGMVEALQQYALDAFRLRPMIKEAEEAGLVELERAIKLLEGMIDAQQQARQEPRLTLEGQARISGELSGLRMAVATLKVSIERMEGTV